MSVVRKDTEISFIFGIQGQELDVPTKVGLVTSARKSYFDFRIFRTESTRCWSHRWLEEK